MGALFRSEEMALCQLFIQPEAAYSSVSILGELGKVQFRDLNTNVSRLKRKFVAEVRRCEELERELRYIESEVLRDDVKIPESRQIPEAPNPREMIDLEARLEKTEHEILELSQNAVNLKSNFVELMEMKQVLEKAQVFLHEQEESEATKALFGGDDRRQLSFVAGVIQRDRLYSFERMLWRMSRGNVFVRQAEVDEQLEDPRTGEKLFKSVFVAFFQGENLKSRVKKICAGYHVNLYPCPTSTLERTEMLNGVRTQLEDLNLVLNQTSDHRRRLLASVAKQLFNWSIMVRKMKAIYHTLNMFNLDVTNKCLIGECWVPTGDLEAVKQALIDGGKAVGSTMASFLNIMETLENPPSYVRTNKFTSGFQTLISAYGVSTYREVNPALYSIVTFPFLFAVMFGDLGHGIIVLLFGLYMVLDEKRYMVNRGGGEIWRIMFGGRYIILMMGMFSLYTGLIYNDVFSKSVNIFGSSWKPNYNMSTIMNNRDLQLDPAFDAYSQNPYPFGLDPVWQLASNKIIFQNSFKMKLSIIMGIAHMIFGVCLSVVNHVHFDKKAYIFLDFLPQILFLTLLFGYLVSLMFIKWVIYFPTSDVAQVRNSPTCAPNILITFINMILFSSPDETGLCSPYMFSGQHDFQIAVLLLALVCIPWLLMAKPIYIALKRRNKPVVHTLHSNGAVNHGVDLLELEAEDLFSKNRPEQPKEDDGGHGDMENEPMSEIMVYQGIHTIEYILSTVSHTASYLRLWALSLAHAQLSEVLWQMVFQRILKMGSTSFIGAIMNYIVFAVWAFFTLAILVLMEGLSAFLHTLRLHWVEFMSKFYMGGGYAFVPFSFKDILDEAQDDDD